MSEHDAGIRLFLPDWELSSLHAVQSFLESFDAEFNFLLSTNPG